MLPAVHLFTVVNMWSSCTGVPSACFHSYLQADQAVVHPSSVPPADKSLTECNAVDMCQNWSPCYVSNPPKWVNGITDIIL